MKPTVSPRLVDCQTFELLEVALIGWKPREKSTVCWNNFEPWTGFSAAGFLTEAVCYLQGVAFNTQFWSLCILKVYVYIGVEDDFWKEIRILESANKGWIFPTKNGWLLIFPYKSYIILNSKKNIKHRQQQNLDDASIFFKLTAGANHLWSLGTRHGGCTFQVGGTPTKKNDDKLVRKTTYWGSGKVGVL